MSRYIEEAYAISALDREFRVCFGPRIIKDGLSQRQAIRLRKRLNRLDDALGDVRLAAEDAICEEVGHG